MREEISIKEMLIQLWQGKNIIIFVTIGIMLVALLFSLFLVAPVYEARTTVYTIGTLYAIDYIEAITNLGSNELGEIVLYDIPFEVSGEYVIQDNYENIGVKVVSESPEQAAQEANLIGLYLIELMAEHNLALISVDKESIERQLAFLEVIINENYGEEIRRTVTIDWLADPVYISLMEEKGKKLVELHNLSFLIKENEYISAFPEEYYFYPARVPNQPINRSWKLSTAAAGIVGLSISTLFILLRPSIRAFFTDLNKQAQKNVEK